MKRQPRWWVVAMAIVLAWALTCFGPTSDAQAQLMAADSTALRKLVEQIADDFRNPLVRIECVVAHVEADRIFIDRLEAQPYVSRCRWFQGAIVFVRDVDVPQSNVEFLNMVVLRDRPDFLIMCGTTRAEGPIWCNVQGAGIRIPGT